MLHFKTNLKIFYKKFNFHNIHIEDVDALIVCLLNFYRKISTVIKMYAWSCLFILFFCWSYDSAPLPQGMCYLG